MALTMYPYWIMGAFMVWATLRTRSKDLVRVEIPAVFNWVRFLITITFLRILVIKLFPAQFHEATKDMTDIPWPLTLTVFWEDAMHGLPLVLIRRFLGTAKWTWPIHGILMAIVMLEFGLGHVYQGVPAAMLLSLYIPVSMNLGKKYGFGTVMIGHTLYDLFTVLTLKMMMGT